MTTDNKKRSAIFIIAMGVLFLFVISFLSGINTSHGDFLSGTGGDTTPPVTSIEYASPFYEDGRGKWINTSTTVYVNATDENGVNYTHYEIWKDSDGDEVFETLEKSITVIDGNVNDTDTSMNISISFTMLIPCHHKIEAYSIDTGGNMQKSGEEKLQEEWHYPLQMEVIHPAQKVVFGSSPALADLLPSTPELEIVCGSDEKSGLWRCWSAYGEVLWTTPTETDEARSSPAICDIDGDGSLEIAAGTTSGWNVEVMDKNGDFLWTFPAVRLKDGKFCWHSSPALVDIVDNHPNVDGLEVVIGNNPYNNVWCFDGNNSDGNNDGINISYSYFPWNKDINGDGEYNKGDLGKEGINWDVLWVFNNSQPIIASPAVGDIDNDGYKEVVIGSVDNSIYVINGSNGDLKWSYQTDNAIYSSAALANLDEDSSLEIVVGSNDHHVYCLDGGTGTEQWIFNTNDAVYSSPSIGDVDGDGHLEVVVGSHDEYLYCINGETGEEEWKFSTDGAIYSSPSLASVLSVSSLEWPMFRHDCARTGFYGGSEGWLYVFIGSDDGYLYKLYGTNGSLVSKFLTNGPIHTSPSIADVDGDGAIEILFYDWGRSWGKRDTFWCLEEPLCFTPTVSYVNVDSIPPNITKVVGTPNFKISDDEYYVGRSTEITASSIDNGSCAVGLSKLEYRIWDFLWSPWMPYNDPITFTGGCKHYLEIRATDLLGNAIIDNETFYLDDTPPDVTKVVGEPNIPAGGGNYYITNETKIWLNVTENRICDVGEWTLYWKVWNSTGLYREGSSHVNISIIISEPCTHILGYYANDSLGNRWPSSGYHNETFYVEHAPDLSQTHKEVNKTVAHPGDGLTFTIYYSNTGNMDATNVVITDVIDSNLESINPIGGTYYSSNRTIVWHVGGVAAGDSGSVSFTAIIKTPLADGTHIKNNATIDSDQTEPYTTNDTDTIITSAPDLSQTHKEVNKTVAHPGDGLTFTIYYSNTGNMDATNVVITDVIDSNLESINPIGGTYYSSNRTIVWHVGGVAAGDSGSVSFTAIIKTPLADGTHIKNNATIDSDQTEPYTTNDTDTITIFPVVVIIKDDYGDEIAAGSNNTYHIIIRNKAEIAITNVIITDILPDDVAYISSVEEPSCITDKKLVWLLDSLGPGEFWFNIINTTVKFSAVGKTLHNFVNLTCDQNEEIHAWDNTTITAAPETIKVLIGTIYYNDTLVDYLEAHNNEYNEYITNNTIIYLNYTNPSLLDETFYRIWRWDTSMEDWVLLFDWMTTNEGESLGFYPINLCHIGEYFDYSCCGLYEIEWYSVDIYHNIETLKWNDVYVDCNPPISIKEYGFPSIVEWWGPEEVHWITSDTPIFINATDGYESGVSEIWYKIYYPNGTLYTEPDRPDNFTNYTGSFKVQGEDGIYLIYYKASDNVGHMERERKQKFVLDNSL